ncbi:hypothetical protein BV20DRAFT_978103 [Pilatotrama ljubarskyi]|nr:hypothetical protein BV20DRAFT_978103 [Pilatotrama ljubarskyi]
MQRSILFTALILSMLVMAAAGGTSQLSDDFLNPTAAGYTLERDSIARRVKTRRRRMGAREKGLWRRRNASAGLRNDSEMVRTSYRLYRTFSYLYYYALACFL